MLSKVVTECEASANFVNAAIATHGDAIGRGLEAKLDGERQAGEPPVPNGKWQVTLAGRRMMRLLAALLVADAAHEAELLDDAGPRKERDEAVAQLYKKALAFRQGTAWMYGPEAERALGFDGSTPDEPRTLLRVCKLALDQFDDALAGRAARAGFTWIPADEKAALAASVAQTEAALRAVDTERKEAEATLVAKYAAQAAYTQAFQEVAGLVALLLDMAGEHDLAAKVRPSKRRAGRVTSEEERLLDADPVT